MPDPQFIAALNVNDTALTGWESVIIKRSFADGISTFQFATTEKIFGPGSTTPQIKPGDRVLATLGGQQAANGKVTTRSVAYDAESHQIVISGKSFTKDIADSSVPIKPGDYSGSTFEQIARRILQPHGVDLVIQNPSAVFSKPFKTLAIQYGETGGSLLSRLALMRGVFISDDANGNCVVGQGDPSAATVADLVEGENILRATGLLDDQTAFSEYTFATQTPDASSDQASRWQSATATNPDVASNRTKRSIAEHPDTDGLQARAGIEAAISQWPTVQCTITVPGWFRPDGKLWQPTDNVSVISPMIFPTQGGKAPKLGIQSVIFAQNSIEGTTSTLSLVLPWLLTSTPFNGVQDIGAPPGTATLNAPDFQGNAANTKGAAK